MKTEQRNKIIAHGENLNRIFNTGLEPLALCKKLHRIEKRAHKLAEDYCNGIIEQGKYERLDEKIYKQLDKILNFSAQNIPVFINGDPRGYALKIEDSYIQKNMPTIERDWGGYGLICPEIN